MASQITSQHLADETLIRVEDNLYEQEVCDAFLSAVRDALKHGAAKIRVDSSQCACISSYGISQLLVANAEAKGNSIPFELSSPHQQLREVITALFLDRVITLV